MEIFALTGSPIKLAYINLDARTDRAAYMKKQFADLGIDAMRFIAVEPATLSEISLAAYEAAHPQKRISVGELACSQSHRDAIAKIFEDSGVEIAIILEDDVRISRQFLPVMEGLGASGDWDIVRLETNGKMLRFGDEIGRIGDRFRLYATLQYEAGTAGYAIKRAAADRFLSYPISAKYPNDDCLFDARLEKDVDLKTAQLVPGVIIQEIMVQDANPVITKSDLEKSRRTSQKRVQGSKRYLPKRKILREMARPIHRLEVALNSRLLALSRHKVRQKIKVDFAE